MAKTNKKAVIREVALFCLIVATMLLIRCYVCEIRIVAGESMMPTLKQGNILFVNKLVNNYEPMDVIVINYGEITITKRIVGCPGDTVQIKNGIVYINDLPLQDITCETTEYAGIARKPITLRENEYFVLGDNRAYSCDSRHTDVGIINQEEIIGRATVAIFPFKNLKNNKEKEL